MELVDALIDTALPSKMERGGGSANKEQGH